MIAIDTSSLIAYFADQQGLDVDNVDFAFNEQCGVFPPIVLSEMLSDHKLLPNVVSLLKKVPLLPITAGYWERVGKTRAKILSKGWKARLADTLIAQVCIDNNVPLLTRDSDFRHFQKVAGLQLL